MYLNKYNVLPRLNKSEFKEGKNHANEKEKSENVSISGDTMIKNPNTFELAGLLNHTL